MSQNDFTIANQGFPAFRSDLNSALQALASNSSGTSDPSTTFANQFFYDETNNVLKFRNEDNDAWISLLTLDQVNDNIEAIQATLVTTNTISEETSGNGVIVDGVTLKDGGATLTSNLVIPDAGNIGSASDTDAIDISSGGVVNFTQTPTVNGVSLGGGSMVLLHTTTLASTVDEVVFDGYFSSDYTNYKIIASNVLMETNFTNINMHFYISGARATGSVHKSSAFKIISNSSTVSGFVEQTDTEFAKFGGESLGNYTNGTNANFEVNIFEPLSTNNKKHLNVLTSAEQSGGNAHLSLASGFYNSGTSAISGIEITPSADGFVRGVFKLYGIK